MPTAIVSVFAEQGFVVAADGRDFDLEKQVVVSDSVQKIYQATYPHGPLAYAFSGTDKITPRGSSETLFDYVSEAMKAATVLKNHNCRSLWHYADSVRAALWPLPEAVVAALGTYDSPPQPFIVFIAGYHNGRPKRAHITFFHDGQEPEVSSDQLGNGNLYGAFPREMPRIVEDLADDAPLAAYRTKLNGIETMDEAIAATQKFIAALKDPVALTLDSRCVGIGGHVHVCKVTFADGFQWIIKPLLIR